MGLKISSSAKVKRESNAAGTTHCHILKIYVVLAADTCGLEGSIPEKNVCLEVMLHTFGLKEVQCPTLCPRVAGSAEDVSA